MAMNNSLAEVHPELVSEWSEKNKIKPTEVSIGSHKKVIWRCEKGVDLVPANLELSAMEFNLVNAMSRETTLKNYLSQVKNRYDYVIISCVSIWRVLNFTWKRHNKLNMRHCLCMFSFAYESEHR